jgi:hypothetical protein
MLKRDLAMPDMFVELLREGEQLFAAGAYPAAESKFSEAVATDPHHIQAYAAVLRIEAIKAIATSKEWFGPVYPRTHAVTLLGSMSEDGTTPYVHHAYAGKCAYENYQMAHYLRELMRWQHHPDLLQSHFILAYLAADAMDETRIEFSELGSTLYAAYEKFRNCERAFGRRTLEKIDFIGVESSEFLRDASSMLHGGLPLALYKHWRDVPIGNARIAFSLGVGNYAFESAAEFSVWCLQNRVNILRERFSTDGDFAFQIMGKRFTCFDLRQLVIKMEQQGYRVSMISAAEAKPFLTNGEAQPKGALFEAHIAVSKLTDEEHSKVSRSITAHGLEGQMCYINSDPPIRFDADILRRPLSWATQWRGTYLAGTAPTEGTWNFASQCLSEALQEHKTNLDLAYRPTYP